jgi:hypothetical protein
LRVIFLWRAESQRGLRRLLSEIVDSSPALRHFTPGGIAEIRRQS